ncbi:MAG: glycosyltransferase family 4 protein [Bacillota bacterium]
MKIVLDLTIVNNPSKITGVERVAIESVRELLNIGENINYSVLCSKKGHSYIVKELGLSENKKIKVYKSFTNNRVLTDQVWIPMIINKIKPSLIYYTTLGIPIINKYPFIMIIHDAVAWKLPKTISKGMKYYYKPLIEHASQKKTCRKIITVSEFSKKEIINTLKIKPSKIMVNYLGVTPKIVAYRKKLNQSESKDDYIITIGTLEPRKNIQGLIEAFCLLKSHYNYNGKLLIVGREGWIDSLNVNHKIIQDVVFTGFVTDEELTKLIMNAKVYVFPSLYEGFGLPLLEAMYLGTPTTCSNVASLPEIGGESACYFNPEDSADIAKTINDVLTNETRRKEMIRSGYDRADLFKWSYFSEKLNKSFKELVNGEK